jgi:hypothetical protein
MPGVASLAVNAACPVAVPIADNEISARVPRTNERRPNPLYSAILITSNDAESWYDGVEFTWDKRLSRGVQFQVAYTYSKSEDTTSEATFVGAGDTNQTGPNARYARAKARFDTPHRFTFNGSYRLPFWRERDDVAGVLFGGWTVAAIVRLAHGTPFTVSDTARDLNFDGFTENRPILLDSSILGATVDDPQTSTSILSASKFRSAQYGELTDIIGRNTFFADGVRTTDINLTKVFPLVAGHTLTVRVESFNVFNRVQYGFPTADFSNANFGRLLGGASSYLPRSFQLGVQYKF